MLADDSSLSGGKFNASAPYAAFCIGDLSTQERCHAGIDNRLVGLHAPRQNRHQSDFLTPERFIKIEGVGEPVTFGVSNQTFYIKYETGLMMCKPTICDNRIIGTSVDIQRGLIGIRRSIIFSKFEMQSMRVSAPPDLCQ